MRTEKIQSNEETLDRFDILSQEANKFCAAVGLRENIIIDIYKSDSDWAFTLKTDSILEMAVKEIIRSSLKMKVLRKFVGADALSDFVDTLPMNGRTSLLHLLRASGFPDEEAAFIEAIRKLRNAYAHQINLADTALIELIKSRKDKSSLLKDICNIRDYTEADLIKDFENDNMFLRFAIMDFTLRVLFFAYHIAHKSKTIPRKRKSS